MTTFDVPFSSDVLDVDQFVTPAGRSLVAGALVNGRVGLVDYTPLVRGQRPDDSAQEDERAHADSDQAEQYEGRLFSRGWSVKPATKSCRGARFTQDGTTIRTISKDRTVAAIDVGTGQVVRQWIKAHEYVLISLCHFALFSAQQPQQRVLSSVVVRYLVGGGKLYRASASRKKREHGLNTRTD